MLFIILFQLLEIAQSWIGSCDTIPQSAQSQGVTLPNDQFSLSFWMKIDGTKDNYSFLRNVFTINPQPEVDKYLLSLDSTPSNMHLSSCNSNIDCTKFVLQTNGRRIVDQWVYVLLSIDWPQMFLKVVYTDSQPYSADWRLQIDNKNQRQFNGGKVYDYIPFNLFNNYPFCGEIKDLVLKNYFTVDTINSANEAIVASTYFCTSGVLICEFGDYEYVSECSDTSLYRLNDFDGSGCQSTCVGSNYYDDPVELLCQRCNPSCLSCFGSESNECLACDNASYSYKGQCLTICPDNYYGDNTTKICEFCSVECVKCQDSTATQCQECNYGYYLTTTTCQSTCSNGFYQNYQTKTCDACHNSCVTCSGATDLDCTECPQYLDYTTRKCVVTCPDGTFINADRCSPCLAACTKCTSLSVCTECTTVSSTVYYLSGNDCVISCPQGFFGDSATNLCNSCDPTCYECSGPTATECTKCDSAGSSTYLDANQCVNTCPDGFYEDANLSECMKCNNACTKCNDLTTTNCNECVTNFSKSSLECQNQCPANQYHDGATCQSCHSSCQHCIGPSSTDCATCQTSSYLTQNICLTSCPNGTYLDGTFCRQCLSECALCLDINTCQSCNNNYFLDGTTCSRQCPVTKWKDYATKKCQNCHSSCDQCSGSAPNQCLRCVNGYYYSQGRCTTQCPTNFYPDNNLNSCLTCNSRCQDCTDETFTACTKCSSGYYLMGSVCQSDCPPSYWEKSSDLTCQPCPTECILCTSDTSCQLCQSNQYFYQNFCYSSCQSNTFYHGKLCVDSCPLGYVENGQNCEPQQFKILIQGVNKIYPGGNPIVIEVLAVDLELSDQPELQAHGFTYDWECKQNNLDCKKSDGSLLTLAQQGKITIDDIVQNVISDIKVTVRKQNIEQSQQGKILVVDSNIVNSSPFNYDESISYVNEIAMNTNEEQKLELNVSGSERILFIYNKQKVGEQLVDSNIKLDNYVGQQFNGNDIYMYLYPINSIIKLLINFAPQQCSLSVTPNTDVLGLETQLQIVFGNGVDDSDIVKYSLYLYFDSNKMNEDIDNLLFLNGLLLLDQVEGGNLDIYSPLNDELWFVLVGQDQQDGVQILSQQVVMKEQSVSQLELINKFKSIWNNNLYSLYMFVLSSEYLIEQNKEKNCEVGQTFSDCSGNNDDKLDYNQLLKDLIIFVEGQTELPSYESSIKDNIFSFLIKYTDIQSIYYDIDIDVLTQQFIESVLNQLEAQKSIELRESIEYTFSLGSISNIVSGGSQQQSQSIDTIFQLLNQLFSFSQVILSEISDEEIDKAKASYPNIQLVKTTIQQILSTLNKQSLQQSSIILKQQQQQNNNNNKIKLLLLLQDISTQPTFQYYSSLTSKQNIIDFFNKPINFTSTLHFQDLRILQEQDDQSLKNILKSDVDYLFILQFLSYNPFSFEDSFPYPSSNLPYFSFDIVQDSLSIIDQSTNLTEPIIIYFDVHQEISTLRRVESFNGNYICIQNNQPCKETIYISVLYVQCYCYQLGPITLIEDYLYKHANPPSYPPPLWSVLYIVIVWAPFVVLFISFQLWAFTKDTQDQQQLKTKRDQDLRRKQSMRASIALQGSIAAQGSFRKSDLQQRPTVKGDVMSELVKADGLFGDKPLNREQTLQIQQTLGKAKGYKNIRLEPAPVEEENIYVPNEDDQNDKNVNNEEIQKLLKVLDVLVNQKIPFLFIKKTHTLIGAIFKYKENQPRSFRLILNLHRAYIILIATAYILQLVSSFFFFQFIRICHISALLLSEHSFQDPYIDFQNKSRKNG